MEVQECLYESPETNVKSFVGACNRLLKAFDQIQEIALKKDGTTTTKKHQQNH